MRVRFILIRGFEEFSKLYEIRPGCIHDVKQYIPDKLNLAFEEEEKTFMKKFINGLNSDIILKVFPPIALLEQYDKFFEKYQKEYSLVQKPIFFC